ncbi:MAG: hypothetical protein JWO97_2636 [Acidobacteria bacterium]|nr:hypothetical protein [Acidobacteriota bacterium]
MRGIVFELSPQLGDVGIDRPRDHRIRRDPDRALPIDERDEQLVLFRRELDDDAAARHRTRGAIDRDAAIREYEAALKLNPDGAEAREMLRRLRVSAGVGGAAR